MGGNRKARESHHGFTRITFGRKVIPEIESLRFAAIGFVFCFARTIRWCPEHHYRSIGHESTTRMNRAPFFTSAMDGGEFELKM